MIALAIFFGCILVLAYSEAVGDAASIEGNIPIDHVRGFVLRSVLALFSALWAAYVQPMGVWQFVFMMIGGAFLFSAAFRFLLNRMRGIAWDYVSLSNVYDTVFIEAFGVNAGRAAYVTEGIILAACVAAYLA